MTTAVAGLTARDGTLLERRRWPAAGAWAGVVLVHGLGEHCGRYDRVGATLSAAGLDVQAADLRGFGRSGGRRAWVDRWSDFHDDLEELVRASRAEAPGRTLVLYGHSLGGLIALGYVLDGRGAPDLLVLSAPAIASTIPPWKQAFARVVSRVAPTTMIANGFDAEVLACDPTVAARYRSDPLNVHRSTARLGAEGFAEQARVRRSLDRLELPTLVIHGGEDQLVPTASSEVLGRLPSVTRRVYPGLRHEVHNEAERDAILADVVAWIGEHLPAD